MADEASGPKDNKVPGGPAQPAPLPSAGGQPPPAAASGDHANAFLATALLPARATVCAAGQIARVVAAAIPATASRLLVFASADTPGFQNVVALLAQRSLVVQSLDDGKADVAALVKDADAAIAASRSAVVQPAPGQPAPPDTQQQDAKRPEDTGGFEGVRAPGAPAPKAALPKESESLAIANFAVDALTRLIELFKADFSFSGAEVAGNDAQLARAVVGALRSGQAPVSLPIFLKGAFNPGYVPAAAKLLSKELAGLRERRSALSLIHI